LSLQALLLRSPAYKDESALSLYVPGEPQSQTLEFTKPVVLWASPANAGAEDMAAELTAKFGGLTVSTAEEVGGPSNAARHSSARNAGQATHMLLYLSAATWSDEHGRLAEQVKQVRADKLPIVMAHENDPNKGGCAFSKFFETTPQEPTAGTVSPRRHRAHRSSLLLSPQELINDGLYRDLARSCFPGPHREACAPVPAVAPVMAHSGATLSAMS